MNKIMFKVAMICTLLTCWGVSALRKDTPGVAQRKLNLMIQNAEKNPLTDAQIKQLLNDISPSLKEDYQDMVDQIRAKKYATSKEKKEIVEEIVEETVNIVDQKIRTFNDFISSESFNEDTVSSTMDTLLGDDGLSVDERDKLSKFMIEMLEKTSKGDTKKTNKQEEILKEIKQKFEKKEDLKEEGKEEKIQNKTITIYNKSLQSIDCCLYVCTPEKLKNPSLEIACQKIGDAVSVSAGDNIDIKYDSKKQNQYLVFKYSEEKYNSFHEFMSGISFNYSFSDSAVKLDNQTEYEFRSVYKKSLIIFNTSDQNVSVGIYSFDSGAFKPIGLKSGLHSIQQKEYVEIPLSNNTFDNYWVIQQFTNDRVKIKLKDNAFLYVDKWDPTRSLSFLKALEAQKMFYSYLVDTKTELNQVSGYNITKQIKEDKYPLYLQIQSANLEYSFDNKDYKAIASLFQI